MHLRIKLLIAGVVIAGATGYLAVAGVRDGWVYYLPVDQYVQNVDYHHQRVRLHGHVSEDAEARPGQMSARFMLVGEDAQLPVTYHGAIPDMFKPGTEVVVEGTLSAEGMFQADVLMTKCASKYDAAEHPPHGKDRP
ncbi:MAG: cytochrome c maturation protein CcmE [bacterium]